MNIEGTIELISNSAESFWTSGNIIAIAVAIISILGSIFVAWRSEKNAREISKSNNEIQKKINDKNIALQEKWNHETLQFQEKINQANIDANLIASARIEWIQKVRNVSAELLSLYFSMLNSKDAEKIQIAFNNSIEKTELLVLYFGHEDNKEKNEELNMLLNKESNVGKNELIVSFAINLSQKFNKYNTFIQNGGLGELQNSINKARQEMYRNAEIVKVGEYYHEEAEEMMDVEEPQYPWVVR